jgi:hypothetical protein
MFHNLKYIIGSIAAVGLAVGYITHYHIDIFRNNVTRVTRGTQTDKVIDLETKDVHTQVEIDMADFIVVEYCPSI